MFLNIRISKWSKIKQIYISNFHAKFDGNFLVKGANEHFSVSGHSNLKG